MKIVRIAPLVWSLALANFVLAANAATDVFVNGIVDPFTTDFSYGADVACTSQPVLPGTTLSARFTPNAYSAIWFKCKPEGNNCINPNQYTRLSFWAYLSSSSGSVATQHLRIQGTMYSSSTNNGIPLEQALQYQGRPIPANTWLRGSFPLAVASSTPFAGIWFQSNSNAREEYVYLSNLVLDNGDAPTTSAPPPPPPTPVLTTGVKTTSIQTTGPRAAVTTGVRTTGQTPTTPLGPRLVPARTVSFASINTPVLQAIPDPLLSARLGQSVTYASEANQCDGRINADRVRRSNTQVGGVYELACEGDINNVDVFEWDFNYRYNNSGNWQYASNPCNAYSFNPANPATDTTTAVANLKRFWDCRANQANNVGTGVVAFTGYSYLAHLSITFGQVAVIGQEIGEGIGGTNAHMAFLRGASRQFHVPFAIDVSAWGGVGGILVYNEGSSYCAYWGSNAPAVGCEYNSNTGHSANFLRRSYYTSFMAGVNRLRFEAGSVNFWGPQGGPHDDNGFLQLSELGQFGRKFYQFTHAGKPLSDGLVGPAVTQSIRGIPYAPIAIITQLNHGFFSETMRDSASFGQIRLTEPQYRLLNWMKTIWPALDRSGENNQARGSSYGEIFDVLVDRDLNLEILSAYRAVALVGLGRQVDQQLATILEQYVRGGGTVLASADEINQAMASQSLSTSLLGFSSNGFGTINAASVTDVEGSSWSSSPPTNYTPFCARHPSSDTWYVAVGGNRAYFEDTEGGIVGWDGGVQVKCCRDPSTGQCRTFQGWSNCNAFRYQLSVGAATCAPCNGAEINAGCPTSPGAATNSVSVNVLRITPTTATTFLRTSNTDGSLTPLAVKNQYGSGSFLTLLGSDTDSVQGSWGLNVASRLVDRLSADTWPFVITSSNSAERNGGLQVQASRNPTGWILTLINNNGVGHSSESFADPALARSVTVSMKAEYGAIVGARTTTDFVVSPKTVQNGAVSITVAGGDVAVLVLDV